MGRRIEIIENDKRVIHAASNLFGYDTLCALDADDPQIGTKNLGDTDKRITCPQCKSIWKEAKTFTATDFTTSKTQHIN